jgi:hypothetical protein
VLVLQMCRAVTGRPTHLSAAGSLVHWHEAMHCLLCLPAHLSAQQVQACVQQASTAVLVDMPGMG